MQPATDAGRRTILGQMADLPSRSALVMKRPCLDSRETNAGGLV